tara:strand:+ start:910 stop:1296 length:387 start_codon:yes stop_codon:yes gene_type:complete
MKRSKSPLRKLLDKTINEQRAAGMASVSPAMGMGGTPPNPTGGTVGDMSSTVNYLIQQLQGQVGQELASMGGPVQEGIQALNQAQAHLKKLPQDRPMSGQPRLLKWLLKWALRQLADLCTSIYNSYND